MPFPIYWVRTPEVELELIWKSPLWWWALFIFKGAMHVFQEEPTVVLSGCEAYELKPWLLLICLVMYNDTFILLPLWPFPLGAAFQLDLLLTQ